MLHTRASASPIQGAGSLFTSLTTISRHAGPLRQPNSARQTPQAVAAAAAALNSAASQSLPCQQPHTAASTAPVQLDPEAKARHKRPAGWKAPGPPPAVACVAVELQPNETLSYLTGDWRILQLRNGHRWSMDDMLTAYVALQTVQQQHQHHHDSLSQVDPSTTKTTATSAAALTGLSRLHHVLDMGCGIGSVLLMVAWGLRRMHMEQTQPIHQQQQQQQPFSISSLGVEAQAISYQLALRSIQYNLGDHQGGGGAVQVLHQDLREPLPAHVPQRFELITGTPPYIPPGSGGQSNKPQKGPCCVEIRGGIEDYCQAAAPKLAPGGHFVVCCGLQGQPFKGRRAQLAAASAGLVITRQVTVVTREGKPPLFAVYVMQAAADVLAHAAFAAAEQEHGSSSDARRSTLGDAEQQSLAAQVAGGQLAGSEEVFVVRHADGRHTAAWHAAREAMGLPPLNEE